MTQTLYVLYVVKDVGLAPVWIGVLYGTRGFGALIGALLVSKVNRLFSVRHILISTAILLFLGAGLVPLAQPPIFIGLPVLLTGAAIQSGSGTMYNVTQVSMRQGQTPPHLLGRMTATMRFAAYGVMPLSGILAGLVADSVGVRLTLIIAALGALSAPLWLTFSLHPESPASPSATESLNP